MLSSLVEFPRVRYGLLELYVECSECQGSLLCRHCACPGAIVEDPSATTKSPEITFEVPESSMTVPFPDHNYS